MSGKLYALSSGPGAADLITVRAARILGQLDVLYAPAGRKGGDSLALSIVREYLGAHTEVRCCHFPMSADSAEKEAVWNDVAAALRQHDSLVLMKVYGRFARIKALLAQAGLLDAALMMSEATLPGEQCWRRLREVSDDQPLPYFSTILVNKQWEEA
ncbi:TPA: cobalt-factor II C(20)-methyltransferase [Klebsiella pneumoniae]|uniref:cobalt-factor II C(20)-methyltransferase n=1 Tax=Klebsiella pneumoniae TaxID=573 RepID=UPI000BCD840C|nr:cobalt-factor II C(20)-methyltransferase [Klebsiella pneumoniae]MDQ6245184.1 cobalt-factor II C(20)-methyltransferase [Klebsiella pneumoniae]MDQ6282572.1 cobalt-factor II C(20)-methyltransferase [Klebsiella pneumoniae]MDQ6297145.1 cobalt-factor II C(20)-methyltransferase [Klebsiella pneumoniae]MDQ6302139.1 cobalt-factor II C(20)-methyltransferase [Klebsiella pneumoniae]MDQ6308230.1 cobalt-factor II C(20)-methyltransferase [Klebsiella pneumoniae]